MTTRNKSPKNTGKNQQNLTSSDSLDNREKIGKGNPPKHSQFKPGIAPNPNGRPKGSRNRSTILREFLELSMIGKNPITGKDENLTIEQRMALSMIGQVINKGNVHAYNSINDNLYGKQKDNISIDSPIILEYVRPRKPTKD